MKAAMHDEFGEPAKVLSCRTTDAPEPGRGEVQIRMKLSPIHNHDLWTVRGTYGYKPDLPDAIGGSEGMGHVEAVGEGVDDAMIGKRVTVAGVHGAWAEFFTAPAESVLPLPEEISDGDGAQLIAMPLSALALLETLKAKEGDWIIQTAANGAVGKIMVTLARSRGIHLVNLVRRDGAAEEMQEVAAENVINTSEAGWKDRVRDLTGGGAVSAIDSVGGETGAALLDLLGENGELVVFGTATGEPLPVASGPMIMKQITVKGFWAARMSQHLSNERRMEMIQELVRLAVKGDLPLDVGDTFALDAVTDAVKAAQEPGRGGKILLQP